MPFCRLHQQQEPQLAIRLKTSFWPFKGELLSWIAILPELSCCSDASEPANAVGAASPGADTYIP